MPLSLSAGSSPLRREARFVQLFLLPLCLTLARFVHTGWFFYFSEHPLSARGTAAVYAPEAYRVLIPALADRLVRLTGRHSLPAIYAAFDFVFLYAALSLFYRFAVRGMEKASTAERLVVISLFLAAIQFPIAWIVPWQRPDTTPSALFLAFALWCVAYQAGKPVWLGALAVASLLQGFIRSDLAFVFGIALLIVSLLAKEMPNRRWCILQGSTIAALAGATQIYLQAIRYPHLGYPPGTAIFQLHNNLTMGARLSILGTVLVPLIILGGFILVERVRLEPIDVALVLAAFLFGGMWITVASVQEVRIMVPYLLALCTIAARIFSGWLLVAGTPDHEAQMYQHGRQSMKKRAIKARSFID